MKIVNLTPLPQVRGDSFDGKAFQVIINGVPKNITDTEILIQFKKGGRDGDIYKEITAGAGITKTDSVNGRFKIDAFIVDLPVGSIYWDCQLKDAGPPVKVKTYFGGIWPIEQDISFTNG